MPWPFAREYMQLALVAGLVVGACAPLIGIFLVQKRMSLMGDGIGHVAFAGVAGGVLLGVWPMWSALAASVLGALAVERLRSRGRASGDLAIALFFYGGIAAGVVLLGLAGSLDANLLSYLFGSILTVQPDEVGLVVALGAAVVATVALCGRALFAMAVDEEWARVAGLPVAALNSVLAVLVAVTIVASMRVVGILLVAALMVLPVASGQLLGRSQRATMGWSVVVGLASVVVGLSAAYWWGLAPGGAIVLVAVAAFAVVAAGDGLRRSAVVRRRRGDGGSGPDAPGPAGAGAGVGLGDDRAATSPGSVLTDSQSGW
jgi:zinc transport system permease protein